MKKIVKNMKALGVVLLTSLGLCTLSSCNNTVSYDAEFTWKGIKATATLSPSNGGESIVLEATVKRETTPATCEQDGKITYVATVEYEGQTYQDTKESKIEALGHDYGKWTPVGDGTHSRTCNNDESHVQFDDCAYKTVITKQPTETEGGHAIISCDVCGDIHADEDLPAFSDSQYEVKSTDKYIEYNITINENAFSFKMFKSLLEAEDSQRQVVTSKDTSQGTTLRLDTGKLIEYTVFASEEIEATMYANMWSRGQLQNDTSILDIYDVYVNETKVETSSETTILPAETFGSKWKIDAHAKVGKVHLDKGINFVKVISKKTNVTMLDNLELNYSGKGDVTLLNVKEFQSVEAHIEYVSTDGVEKVGVNGLITNSAYLSPFTKGSNVRLNTIDYVEYAFESSTDIEVALSVDMSLRAIKEATSIFDLYKVFIKENAEEYTEIKSNDNRAIGQSVTSTKNYGEFHTAGITYLSFKAGANYTLKLQSRANTHLESIMFASSELIEVELLAL